MRTDMKLKRAWIMIVLLLAATPLMAQGRGQGGRGQGAAPKAGPIRRLPDGHPDLSGTYGANSGGANYGLERHDRDFLSPGTQGVIVDPPDGKLPYQDWSRKEHDDRTQVHRGYDDPTAHCFVAGVPRSMYTPSPYQILQPPGYVVILFERMSWRQIPLDNRPHLPDNVRLWQGDSVGHWEGDTLVVDTVGFNEKQWVAGSYPTTQQLHLTEKITRPNLKTLSYEFTIDDPGAYSKPWSGKWTITEKTASSWVAGGEMFEYICQDSRS
jgi:hypothetical protein